MGKAQPAARERPGPWGCCGCCCLLAWLHVGSGPLFWAAVDHCCPGARPIMEIWRPENAANLKLLHPFLFMDSVEEPPAEMELAPAIRLPALELPGGGQMPTSGLGMCCRASSVGEDGRRSVLWYLLLGGRLLDIAGMYGNAREIGQGIQQAMARGVPRSEIFVTSKAIDQGYDGTAAFISEHLEQLGLDYVDLMLIHFPSPKFFALLLGCGSPRACRLGTWRALAEARARGQIRHVGVSNFGPRQMSEILELGLAPLAVNQLEYHPWAQPEHREAVAFCHERGIAVTAYCSFGGVEAGGAVIAREHLRQIGERHGKTSGQVLLRWSIQKNVSVVPGTGNPKHMRENLDIYDFHLTEEDMAALEGNQGTRLTRGKYVGIPDSVP